MLFTSSALKFHEYTIGNTSPASLFWKLMFTAPFFDITRPSPPE